MNSMWVASCIAFMAMFGAQGPGKVNHLANERSAYLRSAATQAVEWYPLGDAAYAEAKRRNKPLLIDVGASWCNYCNLMDRESYSQMPVASFINENFVPVKVDYDAQPEITRRFEVAQALANLPAGIPLIMVVTPEGRLFAGGTYFPAKKTGNKPGFMEMLQSAVQEFNTHSSRIQREGVDLRLEENRFWRWRSRNCILNNNAFSSSAVLVHS
jgi:uncharacterized protein